MKAYESPMHTSALDFLAEEINLWARGKGFWEEGGVTTLTLAHRQELLLMKKSQKILLIITELAELTEGLRKPPSEQLPGFTNEEEELADTIIRLLDYAGQYKLRIGKALAAKMAKNKNRPFKHGKEF